MEFVTVTHEYQSRSDATIHLLPIGDIHRGSRGMNERLFYKTIDWAAENPCIIPLIGDYGECIGVKDRRYDHNSVDWRYLDAGKQYGKVYEDLESIKDKIIGAVAGNHEYTYWMRSNTEWGGWLARLLGVKYSPDAMYVRIRFKRKTGKSAQRQNLDFLLHHGWTGARSDGWKIKVIQDMRRIVPQCHMYLMGHVHKLGEGLPTTYVWYNNRDKLREFTQYYYFTGSYVKAYEAGLEKDPSDQPFTTYAARRGYPPTSLGSPLITIRPNRIDRGYDDSHKPPFSIKYETMDWVL